MAKPCSTLRRSLAKHNRTILITGATGTTGLRLAHRLADANQAVLLTYHSRPVPKPFVGARFDWFDPSTYANPFNIENHISSIYIVCPTVGDMLGAVRPFLDYCLTKGVKRFVLLGGTATPKGSIALGKVHEYIVNLGVDYCVKISNRDFLRGIRDEDMIGSATKDGRIPFVCADDIVDVAFNALNDKESHNTEHIIIGPELFNYEEVASLFSRILGRQIIHKRLTDQECVDAYMAHGVEKAAAEALLLMEKFVAEGGEEALFKGDEIKFIGRRRLADYIATHKHLWAPH
ncbi:hypothetical protein H0H92_014331 [Tricholoma furcatifolium]|nr:hypothetical protein H0H92_014331 [Tricholoma furcatifolium]